MTAVVLLLVAWLGTNAALLAIARALDRRDRRAHHPFHRRSR